MRALASALAVAAVAAVGVAAAVDALRGRQTAVPDEVTGELVYSDAACHRHSVRLPGLERRDFLTVGCGVFTRRDNLGVRNGSVMWFAFPVPGGTTTLAARRDIQGQVGSHFRIRAVAWLRSTRFAALMSGPRELLTVWRGPALEHVYVIAPGFTELRGSPSGRYFAAIDPQRGRLLAFEGTRGRRIHLPAGRALAWSPGERYAAVARRDDVVIVPAGGGRPVARLAVRARDVDWRTLAQ